MIDKLSLLEPRSLPASVSGVQRKLTAQTVTVTVGTYISGPLHTLTEPVYEIRPKPAFMSAGLEVIYGRR